MFGHDRRSIREHFIRVHARMQSGEALAPLDGIIAAVIQAHPEYHTLLGDDGALTRDWSPEGGMENPFMHMGMHIAIREQVGCDRPAGVRSAYASLAGRSGDAHDAEHLMMECLGEVLWAAGRSGDPPDEAAYLACLARTTGQDGGNH